MTDDWGALAENHAEDIFRAARSLAPDDESAWDCVQEAFLTAVTTRRPDDLTEPVSWLCGVARNHARHATRGRGRFGALLERLAVARLSRVETKSRDSREALTEGLGRLSPRLREAVVLRYFGRMTMAEVARMQGISETAAKSRVHRGLARLRAILGPLGVLVILVRETGRSAGDAVGELLAAAGAAAPVGVTAAGGGTALKLAGALALVILGATVFTWVMNESAPFEPGPGTGDHELEMPGLTVGVVPAAPAPEETHRQAAPGVAAASSTPAGFQVTLRDLADGAAVPNLPLQVVRRGRVLQVVASDGQGAVHLARRTDAGLRPVSPDWRVAGEIVAEDGAASDLYLYRRVVVAGTVVHKRIGRSRDDPKLFAVPIGLAGSTLDEPTPDPWHPEWLAEHGIARSVPLKGPNRQGDFAVTVPAVRGMALVARAPGCIPTYVRIDPPPPGGWVERVSLLLERQLPVKGVLAMPRRASRAEHEVRFLLTSVVDRSDFHPEELGISGVETFFVALPTWKQVLLTRRAVGRTGSEGRFEVDLGGAGRGTALFLDPDNGRGPLFAIDRDVRVERASGGGPARLKVRVLAGNDWLQVLVKGSPAGGTRLLLYDLEQPEKGAGIAVSLPKAGTMPRGILERGHRYLVLVIGSEQNSLEVGTGGILEYKKQESIELTTLKSAAPNLGMLRAE